MKTNRLFQHLCLATCCTGLLTTVPGCATEIAKNKGSIHAARAGSDHTEKNTSVIRQHHELQKRGEVEAALQNYAEDTKNHGRPVGRDGLRRVLEDIYTTFPDWRMEIVEMIASEDSVVVRCTVSGTHQGVGKLPINGAMLMGVEPTGKRFEVQHIHWYQVERREDRGSSSESR